MSNKEKYISIELGRVDQVLHSFYFGKVNVFDIKDLFTVSPAEYQIGTIKAFDFDEEGSIKEHIEHLKKIRMEGYQRLRESSDKVAEIAKYISDEDGFHVIPNSIILALDAYPANDENEITEVNKDHPNSLILYENESCIELLIPKQIVDEPESGLKPIWVVDGHHRLLGIKKFLDDSNENKYEVLGSFLINKDKVDEAEIFKTVNYKIKPVNKSFYYQIMGEFEVGQDEYIYLHYLTRLLNEADNSPLYSRFKMLGRVNKESERKQTISQAFFVEEMYYCTLINKKTLRHYLIREKDGKEEIRVGRIPVLRYFFINDQEEFTTRIVAKYFMAIRRAYNQRYGEGKWDEDDNVLLKQMSIGAFIEMFPYVYISMLATKGIIENLDEQKNLKIEIKDFMDVISPLFSAEHDISVFITGYLKGTSAGSLRDMASEMWQSINSSDEFLSSVNEYLKWFEKEVYTKS